MADQSPPDAPDRGRRRFLALCSSAAGACAAGMIAAPVVAELVAPTGRKTVTGGGRLDLGAPDDFKSGVPRKIVVRGPSSDAWMTSEDELGPVYVVREGDAFRAFSAICPHLGCAVDFEADKNEYFCPCHDTYFSKDGAVRTGPSQRGLDPLAVKVENGRVLLEFKRFRTGGTDRVEV